MTEVAIVNDNGTPGGRLSQRKRRFVIALLETPTIREAAKAAGVGETTAWNYLREPAVRSELASRTDALITQAGAGLLADMADARQVLKTVMADPATGAGARVSAARAILDAGLRLFELVALAERVSALEQDRKANE